MKLLILGGTGTIGREIVYQALERGHHVTVLSRGTRQAAFDKDVQMVCGDRRDEETMQNLARKVRPEVVMDLACYGENDARITCNAFRRCAEQLIFASSVAAYERPCRSFPIQEQFESLRNSPEFSYGFEKAEMERYLQKEMGNPSSAAITILRPSLTFGRGACNFGILRQNRNVLRRIREGKPVLMTGEGAIPWSFTFTPDLAAAFLGACGNPRTYHEVFHVTNTELVVWEDLYKAVGKVAGREPVFHYIPSALLAENFPSVCAHLKFEKVHYSYFSNEKFQKAVPEYQPKISLEQGVQDLADWWEESNFPYDEEKERLEDRVCRAYESFADALKGCAEP